MGKRRIRLIKKAYPDYNIWGVDTNNARREESEQMFAIKTFAEIETVVGHAELAFVCTTPLSHAKIINICLNAGVHVFTELNLVDEGYKENIQLAHEKKRLLFLSSTFLYRDEIKFIQNKVKNEQKALNYVYHVGQYLPDWHTWESYNDFFVGNPKTNGCRELFAIELPWIVETFGKIKDCKIIKSKNTGLNINYPDNFIILVEHESGHKGTLAVDIISRKAVRNLEVYGEDIYIEWDGTPKGLKQYNIEKKQSEQIMLYSNIEHQEGYSAFVIENAYMNEINYFLDLCAKGEVSNPIYDFEKDSRILRWIDIIEGNN